MLGLGGSKPKGTGPIGLAMNAQEVRLAQRLSGGGFVLQSEPLSPEVDPKGPAFYTEVSRAISTALRRGGFVGKQVVSALPAESLRYKTLRLPPMPAEDLGQAVAWEAAERMQLTDEQSVQYYRAGEVQQGSETREEVIALAANKQEVLDHTLALKRAGLMPAAIDATGAALARMFAVPGASSFIVHLTPQIAQIVGVRDGQVIFDKPIELTVMQGRPDWMALAREIGLCLRYLSVTFGVHTPEAAWACGSYVDEEAVAALSDAMRLPMKTAEMALASRQVLCAPSEAAHWAVAIGLAERDEKGAARRGAA